MSEFKGRFVITVAVDVEVEADDILYAEQIVIDISKFLDIEQNYAHEDGLYITGYENIPKELESKLIAVAMKKFTAGNCPMFLKYVKEVKEEDDE